MILDRTSRDLNIVERDGVICELLIIFVPLAGDQDNVARACQLNGAINGLSAIDNFFIVSRSKSLFDFGDLPRLNTASRRLMPRALAAASAATEFVTLNRPINGTRTR